VESKQKYDNILISRASGKRLFNEQIENTLKKRKKINCAIKAKK
jgi:hypothetical protein